VGIRRKEKKERTVGVYVHIPWCTAKCPYCSFVSVASPNVPEGRYSECVTKELESFIEKIENQRPRTTWSGIESIYFGGGTPSVLSPDAIAFMIEGIRGAFKERASEDPFGVEVTLEANPETLDREKLKGFKAAGVNRLSLGVQSFKDDELTSLGRRHSSGEAREAFFMAKEAGFESVGIDLMYGLPSQSTDDWEASLAMVKELRPEHVSIYGLTIEGWDKGDKGEGGEEETPFKRLFSSGKLRLPTEDDEVTMYWRAVELLKQGGYVHYEISNLSLPGFSSRHNLSYWLGGDYIGLGAGAHSYLARPGWGTRWWNVAGPDSYMQGVESSGGAVSGFEELKKHQAAFESVFLGLRTMKGIDTAAFERRFGFHPREAIAWPRVFGEGLVRTEGGHIRLTPRGITFSNEVF
jgi:oxygen-independent coproporphyrinogen-3 oxidase